jgi:hypothetical protein
MSGPRRGKAGASNKTRGTSENKEGAESTGVNEKGGFIIVDGVLKVSVLMGREHLQYDSLKLFLSLLQYAIMNSRVKS